MSRISLILHKAEAKPKLSVNIKDVLQVQVGFNWLLSHKGIMTTAMTGFNSVAFEVYQHCMAWSIC